MHAIYLYLSKTIECKTPRENPKVNYELCVITMCECSSSTITKVGDVGNVAMRACGAENIWQICIFCSFLL